MTSDLGSIRASLADERASIFLYQRLSAHERGTAAALFESLRTESAKQAALWEQQILEAGHAVSPWRPGLRVRIVGWLVGVLGPQRMLPALSAMKVRGLSIYRGGAPPGASPVAQDAAPPRSRAEESWHRAARGGGALRAAVFGVNDGLISNAGLIVGVSAANPEPQVVVLAGVAGLLAGGFAMAAGEYISVLTQRELLEYQIALEREEIREMPEEEIEELTVIYEAKGLARADAAVLARRIVEDPERGLDTLAREELGLDPHGLASPIAAAIASFLSFAGGALVPLVPHLALGGGRPLIGSLAATAVGLLTVGGLMSLFTGRSAVWSALRMALLGAAAAAATYLIGRLLGVSVS